MAGRKAKTNEEKIHYILVPVVGETLFKHTGTSEINEAKRIGRSKIKDILKKEWA
jgi:hypothetical protein